MSKRITILLLERVPDLGDAGDVVDVSEGYARNYLFPRGLAAVATEGQLKEAESRKKKQEKSDQQELESIERDVEQIDGMVLTMQIAVGPEGKAHGSITTREIVDEIEKSGGVRVKKGSIRLEEPIRETGEYKVQLEFPHGLEAEITLDVRPDEKSKK